MVRREREDLEQLPTDEKWREISQRLREPFDPSEVDFRVQGKVSEQSGRASVLAYIDARVVQDRLDSVVGAGNWSFDWIPLVIDNGEVMVAKGTLTIFGVSKSDAGSASTFEQSLGAVSHCFKRAAVQWGIGRYLYSIPSVWVTVEKNGRIADSVLRDLRARLPRPGGDTISNQPGSIQAPNGKLEPVISIPNTNPTNNKGFVGESEVMASDRQIASIRKLCIALSRAEPNLDGLTFVGAKDLLAQLNHAYVEARQAS